MLRLLGGRRNCLRLEGVCETSSDFYLLTEVCGGGDVMQHLEKLHEFTEEDASRMFRDFVGAIAHCHARRVAHRCLRNRRQSSCRCSTFLAACGVIGKA